MATIKQSNSSITIFKALILGVVVNFIVSPAFSQVRCENLFASSKIVLDSVKSKLDPSFKSEIEEALYLRSAPKKWSTTAKENTAYLRQILELIEDKITKQPFRDEKVFINESIKLLLNSYKTELESFLDGNFNINTQKKLILKVHFLLQFAEQKEIFGGTSDYVSNSVIYSSFKGHELENLNKNSLFASHLNEVFENHTANRFFKYDNVWFTRKQLSLLDLMYAARLGISLIGISTNDVTFVDGQKYSRLEFMIHDFYHGEMNVRFKEATDYFFDKILTKLDDTHIALAFLLLHENQNIADDLMKTFKSGIISKNAISRIWGIADRLKDENDLNPITSGVSRNVEQFLEKMDNLFKQIAISEHI